MKSQLVDFHSWQDSPVHRFSPMGKLVLTLALILFVALVPAASQVFFTVAAGLLLAAALASRIPFRFLMKRLLMLEPFVLGVAGLAFFQVDGWKIFLAILVKSTLCLFSMVLLSGTTPFSDLLAALRRLRIPPLLVTTLALMYRYLFVLLDEAARMRQARASRTFGKSRGLTWHLLATVAGQLFLRSSERAERIYAAMCARGWK